MVYKKQIDPNYIKAIHTERDVLKNTLLFQILGMFLLIFILLSQCEPVEFQF